MSPSTSTKTTETAFAAQQKQHLVKTLGRFDMIFFTVAVVVGLDLIGQAASNGYEAFTWAFVLVIVFLLPYGLVMAEVGSAFTAEGGPYEWVKLTMGRFTASMNTVFYWVTNPLWVGGSLAFIGTEAWSTGVSNIDSGSAADDLFKFLFIWLTIMSAIVSFRVGKWIPTLGALLKVGLVAFFAITVVIYGFQNGVEGIDTGSLKPTSAGLLAIVPLILFSFVGFEGQNGAAEEMKDPQKDVPHSILRSGALATFCYLTPIFLVLLVLPQEAITGLGGFLDAVKESYSIYGGAGDFMYGVTCVLFVLTLMNSGSAWMMCGDRVLAVTAADGGFFPYFGAFHKKLGTPLRAKIYKRTRQLLDAVKASDLVLPWLCNENRPALRLLANEALELHDYDEPEAMSRMQQLLRLNPNDNHGLRDLVVNLHLKRGEDRDALGVIAAYPHDNMSALCFGKVLALFRLGDIDNATVALKAANKLKPQIVKFLVPERKAQPKPSAYGIQIGGDDEAWQYRDQMREVWQSVPGVMEWLKRMAR